MDDIYVIMHEQIDDYGNTIYNNPVGYCATKYTADYIQENMKTYDYIEVVKLPYIDKQRLDKEQRFFLTSQKVHIVRVDGYFKLDSMAEVEEDTFFDAINKENFRNKGLFDGKINLETHKVNKNYFTLEIGEFGETPVDIESFKQKMGSYINKINFVLKHLREAGIKSTKEVQENLLQLR